MVYFYRISIFFYWLAIRIASYFNPKAKLFIEGRDGLLFNIKARLGKENRPRIWFHCASLGEFEQGRPLLESIRSKYPQYAIVLTFFSPSGYQVRKKFGGVDYVFYLPKDSSSNAKQFVLNVNPQFAVFVKYDLWYYFLSELKCKNVPIILIDSIFFPEQGFFKWYGGIQRKMLGLFSVIFTQNTQSISLLKSIDVCHVNYAGDTRFDRVLNIAQTISPIDKIEKLSTQYNLLIAGSTWAEDEQMLSKFLGNLPKNWKLILVPHEVGEKRIKSVELTFHDKITRWSDWDSDFLETQVLVIDTIGLLSKIYRYGKMAWVGGGLGKKGVHNVLEAAVFGLPCAYGPVFQKYEEAIDLVNCKGAICCENEKEFTAFFHHITQDPNEMASYHKES
jgi:3-deoxy-D-manno-octulosonic-acid transferase